VSEISCNIGSVYKESDNAFKALIDELKGQQLDIGQKIEAINKSIS
jgi:hypothetical protein